ncbi:hypothetical protein [Ulvibacter antarcticus]|uniref:Prophage protein DUF1660 n=1 Tax=Ulvibacter antarcticus TaxID=442714 RepID=A0A3L9YYT2_9FLAO|nr:hypothetical protein [Ulvibacter antarcticus]RMA65816.1 hypothetical protein BXY75_0229 [Ulvibacter antarcticus]
MISLSCKIKGHKLSSIQKESIFIEEFECANCNQKFTTDGYGKMVKLNPYWEKNNKMFERILHSNSLEKAQAS